MKRKNNNTFTPDTYYYIIKVSGEGRTYYKLGEGKTNRSESLIKKYMDRASINAETIFTDKLPNNGVKRLNDSTIHKHLKLLKNVDPLIIKGLLNEKDGKTEFFEIPKEWDDEKLINYTKEIVNNLSKNPANFIAKIPSLCNHSLHYDPSKKHLVNYRMIKPMLKKIKQDTFTDKNILLIGQFLPEWISTFALYNEIYIWHDNNEQKYVYEVEELNEHINYINDFEELVNLNKKFNYIIANPPYENGNDITRAIVDNIDFDTYVNLMPCSKYKKGDLYKRVVEVESIEDTFDDATVGNSLTVATISKEANNDITYDEFENFKRDPRFREFYALNAKCNSHKLTYNCNSIFYKGSNEESYLQAKKDLLKYWEDHDRKFCLTWRTVQNGVHVSEGDAFDVRWNIKKSISEANLPISQSTKRDNTCITVDFIEFNTKEECNNFTNFFYSGGNTGIMSLLIKGLNKSSGSIAPALPNIDWSKDRDYEHLTLEDLMNILREENDIN